MLGWTIAMVALTGVGFVLYNTPWRDNDERLIIEMTPERRAMIVQQERLEQQMYRHMDVKELL